MKSLEIVNREFNCFTDRLTPLEKKFPLQLDINYNELQLIKQDLIFAEELKQFIKDFELPKSLYLIGYFQAKIREKEGDFNE